jgi:hypothetical protein
MKTINIKSKLIIVFLFVILLTVGAGYQLKAQFFYEESCRNGSGAFKTYGDASYVGSGGDGWLRLTPVDVNKIGYVLIQESYPSNLGLTIEFDFKVWGKPYSSSLADGFSVFLFNASVTDQNFNVGHTGGSLGYLPNPSSYPSNLGLLGAYLGVLIDEYGTALKYTKKNYYTNLDPNVITIAVPASEDYPYIGNSSDGTVLSYKTADSNDSSRPADGTFYRRVRIQIDPADPEDPDESKRTGMNVSVYLKIDINGTFTRIIEPTNVSYDVPPSLRFGFAGVTGPQYAYHEVRDVFIKTSGNLAVYKNIDMNKDCAHNTDPVDITTTVANGDFKELTGVVVSDTLPAGFVLTGDPVLSGGGSATQQSYTTTDGRRVYSYTLNINQVGTVYIKYSGTMTVNSLSSAVGITPPVGFVDNSVADNYARDEILVPLDYGDAPESYGQAAHFAFGCLKLGAWTDANKPEQPVMSIDADADADANDDAVTISFNENGFVNLNSTNFKLNGTNLNVNVSVHNSSDRSAKLIGWIDFNQNGIFDSNEASVIETVTTNATNPRSATLVWANANARLRDGISYLRIRITTDSNADATNASGFLFNGEVEDYKLNFDILDVSKAAASNNKYGNIYAKIGDTIAYTVTVHNKITGDVTVFDPHTVRNGVCRRQRISFRNID